MKYKWLNKQNNSRLIIFFNGLGMDENAVKHLNTEDYDVVMFYDYNNLETNFDFSVLNNYAEKNLIAWSMGVMVATNFFSTPHTYPLPQGARELSGATAINGTLTPIDTKFGINPKIYNLTIRGFDSEKFVLNMLENVELANDIKPNREAENQKNELIAIKNYSAKEGFEYNKILISDNDKIIPTKSQCAYWNIEANLTSGHYPFHLFKKWSEIL